MPKYTFFPCSFRQFQPQKEGLVFVEIDPSIYPKEERNRTKGKRRCRLWGFLSPFDGIESPFRENKTPKEFTQSASAVVRIPVPAKLCRNAEREWGVREREVFIIGACCRYSQQEELAWHLHDCELGHACGIMMMSIEMIFSLHGQIFSRKKFVVYENIIIFAL